jgi:hypothetical protein
MLSLIIQDINESYIVTMEFEVVDLKIYVEIRHINAIRIHGNHQIKFGLFFFPHFSLLHEI